MRMASLDKKQIKRMTVELLDYDVARDLPEARVTIRLWNATGCPLYDTDAQELLGGERQAPVSVMFTDMVPASVLSFVPISGVLKVARGALAAPPLTEYLEHIYTPKVNINHDAAVVSFLIGTVAVQPVTVIIQCGNATYVGQIQTGPLV